MPFENAVIAFDLDGTLVDSAPDLIGALNLVLAEHGLAPAPLAAARHLVGGGAVRMLEHGFAEAGAPLDADAVPLLAARFVALYRTRIVDETIVFPGVEAALDGFRAQGARLVVVTNKATDLSLEVLEGLGLLHRFEAVVGPDLVSACKPDAAHLLHAIARVGGDPGRALMVGDSAADVGSARAAGVPVVAVSFGYTETPVGELGADRVIDAFEELPAAARALLTRRG